MNPTRKDLKLILGAAKMRAIQVQYTNSKTAEEIRAALERCTPSILALAAKPKPRKPAAPRRPKQNKLIAGKSGRCCASCYHPSKPMCLKTTTTIEYGNQACTRAKGHRGPHQACGTSAGQHPIHSWK